MIDWVIGLVIGCVMGVLLHARYPSIWTDTRASK